MTIMVRSLEMSAAGPLRQSSGIAGLGWWGYAETISGMKLLPDRERWGYERPRLSEPHLQWAARWYGRGPVLLLSRGSAELDDQASVSKCAARQ